MECRRIGCIKTAVKDHKLCAEHLDKTRDNLATARARKKEYANSRKGKCYIEGCEEQPLPGKNKCERHFEEWQKHGHGKRDKDQIPETHIDGQPPAMKIGDFQSILQEQQGDSLVIPYRKVIAILNILVGP